MGGEQQSVAVDVEGETTDKIDLMDATRVGCRAVHAVNDLTNEDVTSIKS